MLGIVELILSLRLLKINTTLTNLDLGDNMIDNSGVVTLIN